MKHRALLAAAAFAVALSQPTAAATSGPARAETRAAVPEPDFPLESVAVLAAAVAAVAVRERRGSRTSRPARPASVPLRRPRVTRWSPPSVSPLPPASVALERTRS